MCGRVRVLFACLVALLALGGCTSGNDAGEDLRDGEIDATPETADAAFVDGAAKDGAVDSGDGGRPDASFDAGGQADPSGDILQFALDVATGATPSNRNHLDMLLQRYRDRAPRRLSEPGYITDLSFVWFLLKRDLTAQNYIKTSFCEAYLSRLANLLLHGEIFTAAPSGVDTPQEVFAAITRGTWSPVWNSRTTNNRHAREAAALVIASLILGDAKNHINGCYGASLATLFSNGSPLKQASINATNEVFAPQGNFENIKYKVVHDDGSYKEGPGYLNFTNRVLMPMVFFYDHYKSVNLFRDRGEFTAIMPARLRGLFNWLYATQDDDGAWPSMNDASRISHGMSFATAIGVYMLRQIADTHPELRKTYCGMLGRVNRFKYYDELETLCAQKTTPFENCGSDAYVRLAGLLFGPNAGGDGAIHSSLGLSAPQMCGGYYREGTAQYRKPPATRLFDTGGQLYVRSNDDKGIQARFFNEGSWFDAGGDLYRGYVKNGTTYDTRAKCDTFADGSSDARSCHFELDLRAWFSTDNAPLAWHPRTANHKRYNDSHIELRAFGKDLLIGPGKMDYIPNPVPYEEWNSPRAYNLTRTQRRWPKTLYLQGDVSSKMKLIRARAGCGELYKMSTDTYDRYVIWAHNRYLLVTDRINANTPLYIESHYHVRGERRALSTPKGRSRYLFGYVDRTSAGNVIHQDRSTQLTLYSLLDNDVVEFEESTARDSCQDDTYEQYEADGYCAHAVLTIKTKSSTPQAFLSMLVWPQQGSDAPELTFSNVVRNGTTTEALTVNIQGSAVNDTWTIAADNPEAMFDGTCGF